MKDPLLALNKQREQIELKMVNVGLLHIEKLVRNLLEDFPEMEFIMAMGTWHIFFPAQEEDKKIMQDVYNHKKFHQLEAYIDKWDEILNLTGCPMRINGVNGKVLTDW